MARNVTNVPLATSSSTVWMEWHKALKSQFGKKKANELFLMAWDKRAGAGSDASTTALREYLTDNGLEISTTGFEDAADFGSSVGDSLGGIFTGGKYLIIGLGVILVGGLAMTVFNIAKQPVKAAASVIKK